MSKYLKFSFLLLFIPLSGCSSISKYDDNEPAAIVKGQEITIGDLRFLYPDDAALDYLDWAIKVELVKQEVKDMGLNIAENLEAAGDWFAEMPPKNTKDEGGKQIRKYAESQAKKLDMKPEEFQLEYAKRINEQNAYLATYLEKELGKENFDSEKMIGEFNEEANHLLEELVEENKDEIEVLIKRSIP